jgi:hypothetical protein
MEQVFVIAKSSFVSQSVGSVSRKQRLLLSKSLANEFVAMGLVEYEVKEPVKKPTDVGTEKQSVSSQAETASATLTLPKSKRGKSGK